MIRHSSGRINLLIIDEPGNMTPPNPKTNDNPSFMCVNGIPGTHIIMHGILRVCLLVARLSGCEYGKIACLFGSVVVAVVTQISRLCCRGAQVVNGARRKGLSVRILRTERSVCVCMDNPLRHLR